MDWFLYDNGPRHERVNIRSEIWQRSLKHIESDKSTLLLDRGDPICGNRITEGEEKCDCGFAEEASCAMDPCCIGAPGNGSTGGCKYSMNATGPSKCRLGVYIWTPFVFWGGFFVTQGSVTSVVKYMLKGTNKNTRSICSMFCRLEFGQSRR